LFTYAKAILTLLQLAKMLVSLGERNMWIEDGERRAMNRELLAINKAMRIKEKIGKEVDAETDQQVLDGLIADGDIRPDERLPQ
jgi:hypothetical protein